MNQKLFFVLRKDDAIFGSCLILFALIFCICTTIFGLIIRLSVWLIVREREREGLVFGGVKIRKYPETTVEYDDCPIVACVHAPF